MHEAQQLVEAGSLVCKLLHNDDMLEDTSSVGAHNLHSGSLLHVVVKPCAYLVEGAGVLEVNGYYEEEVDNINECPCFTNAAGVLLFRYTMVRTGTNFWYFSFKHADPTKSAGDIYRVKSDALQPPLEGWEWQQRHCPSGRLPLPCVIRLASTSNAV